MCAGTYDGRVSRNPQKCCEFVMIQNGCSVGNPVPGLGTLAED